MRVKSLDSLIESGDTYLSLLNGYETSTLLVSNLTRFVYVRDEFGLGIRERDTVKEGSATHTAIASQQPYVSSFDKDSTKYKKGYWASSVPVFNHENELIGALTWVHQNENNLMRKTGRELYSLSEELASTSEQFVTNASSLNTDSQKSYQQILQLNQQIAEIGKVTEIITEISSQSNLLGLNAAIEAARVGDAGRGFAIVAEEVRKLADKSKGSAKSIKDTVNQITKTMSGVLQTMQSESKASEAQAGEAQELSAMAIHLSKLAQSLIEDENYANDKIMEWDNSKFSVHDRTIDSQHKTLVDLVNKLYSGVKNQKSKAVLKTTIEELVNYTVTHFSHEEQHMRKIVSEAEYKVHKAQHEAFVDKVSKFQKAFLAGETDVPFEVIDFLKDWLIRHIMITDKKYAR